MKNFLLLLLAFTLLPLNAKTITGTVKDNKGALLPGVHISVKGTEITTQTDSEGCYSIVAEEGDILVFSYIGFQTLEQKIKGKNEIHVRMLPSPAELNEVVELQVIHDELEVPMAQMMMVRGYSSLRMPPPDRESYKEINENIFQMVGTAPLSTFSIDVDRASYSNIRRMINNGQEVPKDAVKIEEMINYFNYDYPQPTNGHPFAIHTEVAGTPWNKDSQLVKIALQGKKVPLDDIPASNLVFLLDVSGSMNAPNKLPLLKSAFKLLTNQLREQDKVAIVVYAGAAGVVLPSTNGGEKSEILGALEKLSAGGSTAGGAGIELAYQIAEENFIEGGNNRVILATDGDFNVGASSDRAMEELIEEKRTSGIFLTALGFGMGNYQDSKLETLAGKGNGNHAYIDTMQEAQRVLGTEFGGTLYTIAKDVKIQVEFNPAKVQAYRLIGYENRMLNAEDFKDDKKDAGELGSGHTVTALYEVLPVGVESKFLKDIDSLKYTNTSPNKDNNDELLTVKFRYKDPEGSKSKELVKVVKATEGEFSSDFKFATAVALYGMKLRNSEFANAAPLEMVLSLARDGRGNDEHGYRAEFVRLVESHQLGK